MLNFSSSVKITTIKRILVNCSRKKEKNKNDRHPRLFFHVNIIKKKKKKNEGKKKKDEDEKQTSLV